MDRYNYLIIKYIYELPPGFQATLDFVHKFIAVDVLVFEQTETIASQANFRSSSLPFG